MEKFTFPTDKYSVEEFMVIFNKRADELYKDAGKIPYEEAFKRFSDLYKDIPLGLHIDAFSLEEKLNNCYPEWKERYGKIFKIKTKKIKNKNMKLKLILFFLAALLLIIVFKMIFVGVVIFVHLVKYIVIAAAIAYGAYWISKNLKKDE